MDTSAYQNFAKEKLGFEFNNIDLLVVAITHRSYVNEHKKAHLKHNERLEYLGDAVLELVTSDFLYRNYEEPEGIMTAWRAALVRTESISDAGYKLGYEPLVRLSRGEQHGISRAHAIIIADCFEAVIGAIYLDQGYDTAKDFIYKHILSKINEILEEESWRDPKSYFQELAQKYEFETPVYRTLKEDGPDHNKTFTVAAYVGKSIIASATGHSKQEAQTLAAKQGIKLYKQKYESTKRPKPIDN